MSRIEEPFPGEKHVPRKVNRPWQAAASGILMGTALIFALTDSGISLLPRETLLSLIIGFMAILSILTGVLELRSGSADPTGIYGFIKEVLPQPASFLGGWSMLLGTSAASALLAIESTRQIQYTLGVEANVLMLPLALICSMILLELLPRSPLRRIHGSLMILIFILFLVLLIQAWSGFRTDSSFNPSSMINMTTSMQAAALLMVLFLPFEMLLSSRAARTISRTFFKPVILLGTGLLVSAASGLILTAMFHTLQAQQLPLGTILQLYSPSRLLSSTIPLLILLIGLRYAILTAARQLHALSRAGMLPGALRRIRQPFDMPVLLFSTVSLLASGWLLLESDMILQSGTSLIIFSLLLLNAAAIRSRIKEPERRRAFQAPLFPLIPAVSTLVLGALLLRRGSGLPLDLILLAIGAAVYYFYSRHHSLAAGEGSIRFSTENGEEPLLAQANDRASDRSTYRILLPLTPGQERHLALKIAVSLARQLDASLIPLQVIPIPDPLAMEEGKRLAKERNILFQWSLSAAEQAGLHIKPVTRFARTISEGIIEAALEEECDLILMPWTIGKPSRGVQLGHILDPVLNDAQCDVAVVAFPEPAQNGDSQQRVTSGPLPDEIQFDFTPKRILVPTAGGPNAPLAFRFALSLANEAGGTVTAVYAAHPDADEAELAVGQERINKTIRALKEEAGKLAEFQAGKHPLDTIEFDSLIIKSENIADGIAEAGKSFDLVLLGASEERIIDQMLLGTIPEQVARKNTRPTIMVKRYRGLRRYWLQHIWKLFFELIPTLSQEERIEVYRTVRRDARPDIDYFIMMGLSAAIATFGLLQNSGAVIIGAMLVAPLFTPILALSLSIVQGDMPFFQVAVESSIKGIALAVGLALVLTGFSPLTELTNEIIVRSQPNLFDLLIALASGIAGAYAIARKDVATSLPGVAIAAALVPPLSVVGIGLAHGNLAVAGGSALLFATNLVAIVLSGAITLMLLGFLPRKRDRQDIRLRWAFFVILFSLGLILIPLFSISSRTLTTLNSKRAVAQLLSEEISADSLILGGYEIDFQRDSWVVSVQLLAVEPPPEGFADHLREEMEKISNQPVELHLIVLPVQSIQSPALSR